MFPLRKPVTLGGGQRLQTGRRASKSRASVFGESAEDWRSQSHRLIVCDSAHWNWDTFPYDLHDPFNWLSLRTLWGQSRGFSPAPSARNEIENWRNPGVLGSHVQRAQPVN